MDPSRFDHLTRTLSEAGGRRARAARVARGGARRRRRGGRRQEAGQGQGAQGAGRGSGPRQCRRRRLQAEGRGKNRKRRKKNKKKRRGGSGGGQPPPPPPSCCGTEACPDPEPGSTSAGCDFAGRSFAGQDHNGSIFRGIDGREAVFTATDNHGSVFAEACLQGARFRRANLGGSTWGEACLFDADFTGADLGGDVDRSSTAPASAAPPCRTARSTTAIAARPIPAAIRSWAPASPAGVRPTAATRPAAPGLRQRPMRLHAGGRRAEPERPVRHRTAARASVAPPAPPSATRRGCAAPRTAPAATAARTGAAATCGTCPDGTACFNESGTCICNPGTCDGCCANANTICAPGNTPPGLRQRRRALRTCGGQQVCHNGQCCTPNCTGRYCGPDGCGGSCGNCAAGQRCDNGRCVCDDAKLPQRLLRCQRRLPAGDREPGLRRRRRACATCPSGQGCINQACAACNAQTCPQGCCAADHTCQPGNAFQHCGGPGGAACAGCSDTQTCQNRQCVECGDSCPCSGQSICFNAGAPNVVCPLIPSTDLGECFVTLTGQPICSSSTSNLGCNTDADCRELAANAVCVQGKQPNNPQPQCEPNPFCVIPGTPA